MKTFTLTAILSIVMGAATSVMAQDYAIVGGRVVTNAGDGVIENGTVLVQDGRISQIGSDLRVPDGFEVIDARGKWVTPGLMNAQTSLGLVEIGLESSTNDITPDGGFGNDPAVESPYNAGYDVAYAINPTSTLIPVQRIEGLTRVISWPGAGDSVFAGRGAALHLGAGMDIVTHQGIGMFGVLGSAGGFRSGGSRASAYQVLEQSLEEAAALAQRGRRTVPQRERDSILSAFEAEALIPVVEGDMPLVLQANRTSDLLQIIALGERHPDLNLVIAGAAEAWMVADRLAEAGIPVLIDGTANLPSSFDALASTLRNAARLADAGVDFAFVTGDAHNARLLPQLAGNSVAEGLDWSVAFQAITLTPARIFGIDDSIGSLERGKDADIVVWDGDPLDVTSNVDAVLIRGHSLPLESRQTRLRDRYMELETDYPHAYRK